MKYWLLIILCFCFYGCGDEAIEDVLQGLSVPSAPDVAITGVPPEIQELLWDNPEQLKERFAAVQQDDTQPDSLEDAIRFWLCRAKQQRLYYTKYIDAGGIAIIGNSNVTDQEFRVAREIVLRMTAKRPELRKLMSPITRFRVILIPYEESSIKNPDFACIQSEVNVSSKGGRFWSIHAHIGLRDRLLEAGAPIEQIRLGGYW